MTKAIAMSDRPTGAGTQGDAGLPGAGLPGAGLPDAGGEHDGHTFKGLHYPFGPQTPEPGTLMKVADGVFWLRMPLPMQSLQHINLYVLDGEDGWTIVDTGLRWEVSEILWEQLLAGPLADKPVARVIATHFHPDHMGMAGWLCERTGAPLYMSRNEFLLASMLIHARLPEPPEEVVSFYRRAGWGEAVLEAFRGRGWGNFARAVHRLPVAYRRLQDEDALRIGGKTWRVVMGHGHSPEHACLVCAEAGVMIAGDQVLPRITPNVSVTAMEPEANPLEEWLASIDKLRTLPPDLLVLPAHGEPFHGLYTRLDQMSADHAQKLERLLAHCAAPRTVVECFEVLFRKSVTANDIMTGTGEALAHLNYLKKLGRVEERLKDGVAVYAAA